VLDLQDLASRQVVEPLAHRLGESVRLHRERVIPRDQPGIYRPILAQPIAIVDVPEQARIFWVIQLVLEPDSPDPWDLGDPSDDLESNT
jgi:hypothetical protein